MADTHVIDVPMDAILSEFAAKLGLCPPRFYMVGDEAAVDVKLDDGNVKQYVSNEWHRSFEGKKYQASLEATKWIEKEKNSELVDYNFPERQLKLICLNHVCEERLSRAGVDPLLIVMGRKLLADVYLENQRLKAEVVHMRALHPQED